ncbi:unnamed protein product [Caenorhabditis bovis]|uniref:Uncharacterized protein n=1 Tax=Caenorhabditis bovis TaxID=2654633 RepID=A0A8S1F7L5_9PELO|nr:unnamed protein product [Caenorhabditis bovis]
MKLISVVILVALLAFANTTPVWYADEDFPIEMTNYRLVRIPLSPDNSADSRRSPILKRAAYSKRRGRELFGKRSSPLQDEFAPEFFDSRTRRRANELFG